MLIQVQVKEEKQKFGKYAKPQNTVIIEVSLITLLFSQFSSTYPKISVSFKGIVLSQWKNLADTLLTNHLRLISSSVIRHIDISSVQLLSCVRLFATPWTAAHQACLSITNAWSLLKFMSIELVMPSNHLILCYPLLLLRCFSQHQGLSNESVLCIRWPTCWSFSFSLSPSNEYSGLISFWMDWFDLLLVQRTLKRLLQHHSSKASILQHSAFFIVQLTSIHDYWKNHSLDQTDLCWQSNVSAF